MNPDDAYQDYRDETTAELADVAAQARAKLDKGALYTKIYKSLLSTIGSLDGPHVPDISLDVWTALLMAAYNEYHRPIDEDDDDAPF